MIDHMGVVQYNVSFSGPLNLPFRSYTKHDISRMSRFYLGIYVEALEEQRKVAARMTFRYLKDSPNWRTAHRWLEQHWLDEVKPVADLRRTATEVFDNWQDYTNAALHHSANLAQVPDTGVKDQKDGFTRSGLHAAQYRCVLLRTWPIIQDYIDKAYFTNTAPAPSTTDLLRYGYIAPEEASRLVNFGCQDGLTPEDFYSSLTYFPLMASKLAVTSATPDAFAKSFSNLVDEAVKGQASLNGAVAKRNEAESKSKSWCASGERSPLSIIKWALLELRNKHKNEILACVPEAASGPFDLFPRNDYTNLHDAIGKGLGSVATYDGSKVKLSGMSSWDDMHAYLKSGIDKSALPTTIDF